MKKTRIVFSTICLFLFFTAGAQTTCPPFWNDIQAFKKADSAEKPAQGAIVFVGSSSFTRWKDVAAYFPEHTIINRGFGGSQLTDVIRYVYDVVLPYKPKQVVVYCGENDLASDSMPADEVVNRFKTLYSMLRQNLPQTYIHFISLKPSPSREQFLPKFVQANKAIQAFLKKEKRAGFINIYPSMLDRQGQLRNELFVEDRLHMTDEGYRIWQRILLPYLKK